MNRVYLYVFCVFILQLVSLVVLALFRDRSRRKAENERELFPSKAEIESVNYEALTHRRQLQGVFGPNEILLHLGKDVNPRRIEVFISQ